MLNIHTALSALWTWAVDEGNVRQNGLGQFPGPKPEKSAITPISEKDIQTLLEPRRSLPLVKLASIRANHVGNYGAQAGSSNMQPTTSTSTPSQPVRRPVA